MNTTFSFRPFLYILFAGLLFSSCRDKDKVSPVTPPTGGQPIEQELITTLILHFHSEDGTDHKVFTFRDLDGEGGLPPVIEVENLLSNTVYNANIEVLDESRNPAVDITAEIEEEGDHHQFFFQVTGANASVTYNDADEDGLPIGLLSIWTLGEASSGNVKVTLRHDLNKSAAGVSAGDITNAGGDTDIEVVFPVVIE